MSQPPHPHDQLFRALLDDPGRARALVRDYLPPAIAARLADRALTLVDASFIDPTLRGSQSDRLFKAHLTDGRPAFVYTLLEHKSQPDPRTPLQLLGYMLRIWERHLAEDGGDPRALPPVVPLVIYHGRAPWTVPTSVLDSLDADEALRAALQDFRYVVHDLGHIPDAALARHKALRAGLAALKYAFTTPVPPDVLVAILRDLPDADPLERQVFAYIIKVHQATRTLLERAVAEAKPERREDLMGTVAEELLNQGRAEGQAKGLAEGEVKGKAVGLAEGKAESVLRILRVRFGEVDETLERRIRRTEAPALDALLDRALAADRPEDIL